MRILLVCPRAPQKDGKGDALTVYHLVRFLHDRGHHIVLAAFVEKGAESNIEEIRPFCTEVVGVPRGSFRPFASAVRGLVSKKPLQIWFYRHPEMGRQVRRLVSEHNPDLVYAHYIRMAEYVRGDDCRVPRVLAMQLSHAKNYFEMADNGKFSAPVRALYRLEAQRTLRYEFDVMPDFDRCMLISSGEKEFIDPKGVRDNVFFNPHGVESDFYCPQEDVEKIPDKLVFTGSMDFHPNVDAVVHFVNEILPEIKKQRPAVTFDIVGREPTSEVLALHNPPDVVVTGAVPDVRPYISSASVMVIPIRAAAGLQNKLLIGMSMASAIVCTPNGNGVIGAVHDRDIVEADTPDAFADAVTRLLSDGDRRKRLQANAREFIRRHWTWEVYLSELEEMFLDLVSKRSAEEMSVGSTQITFSGQ